MRHQVRKRNRLGDRQAFEKIDDACGHEQCVNIVARKTFSFDCQCRQACLNKVVSVQVESPRDGRIRDSIERGCAEQHGKARVESHRLNHACQTFIGKTKNLIRDDFEAECVGFVNDLHVGVERVRTFCGFTNGLVGADEREIEL